MQAVVLVDTVHDAEFAPGAGEIDAALEPFQADFKAATEKFVRERLFVPASPPEVVSRVVADVSSAAPAIAVSALRHRRVVKAFSTTGAGNMADPVYGRERATMFLCGDDGEAKRAVARLAEELGFDVCDTGALYTARYLEPLAMLWVHLAHVEGLGPNFAFKLLKR